MTDPSAMRASRRQPPSRGESPDRGSATGSLARIAPLPGRGGAHRGGPARGRASQSALIEEIEYLRNALAEAYSQIAHLENLADMDSLVPALNRRAFMRQLNRTISFGERYDTVNSVVYVDINGMKEINDGLGHGAGDAALKQIVDILNAEVRHSDVVGRLGGDEFGIILVQTDHPAAHGKVTSLATAVAGNPLVWQDEPVPLDAAFGIHTIAPGDDAHSVLVSADRAMYREKQRSRASRRAAVTL